MTPLGRWLRLGMLLFSRSVGHSRRAPGRQAGTRHSKVIALRISLQALTYLYSCLPARLLLDFFTLGDGGRQGQCITVGPRLVGCSARCDWLAILISYHTALDEHYHSVAAHFHPLGTH